MKRDCRRKFCTSWTHRNGRSTGVFLNRAMVMTITRDDRFTSDRFRVRPSLTGRLFGRLIDLVASLDPADWGELGVVSV